MVLQTPGKIGALNVELDGLRGRWTLDGGLLVLSELRGNGELRISAAGSKSEQAP